MVTVKIVKKNQQFKTIIVKGHALYDDVGKDIVCAAISSICIGLMNAIDEMDKASCQMNLNENDLKIDVVANNETIQTILNVGYIQLETIAEKYPKNLIIEFTEV